MNKYTKLPPLINNKNILENNKNILENKDIRL